jgi:nickel-dependent lactate racemase
LSDELDVNIIEPKFTSGLTNPGDSLRHCLKNPIAAPSLKSLVSVSDRIGIIFNDITRATPNNLIIHAVIDQLNHIPSENIILFNALGTHRANTMDEMRALLDDQLVNDYRIVQNNWFDPTTQVSLGMTKTGNEIWINRDLFECDLKILTGFIEPHFFAGFSGGGKAVMPGMAGLSTVQRNHSSAMIGHPRSTWGVTKGNPIWEEINEAAHKVSRAFLVNVTLNKNKEITGVYCGDLDEAHKIGCAAVKESSMCAVPEAFDIVITTNSGYPLDINLYQSVKGMSAAAQIVKQGGAIIIATECCDGVPEHGLYGELLRTHKNPSHVLESILTAKEPRHDQWQVQVQAQIQQKAEVHVFSSLTDAQVRNAMLIPCHDIEATVKILIDKYGRNARICIIPEGPQTIPYIETRV